MSIMNDDLNEKLQALVQQYSQKLPDKIKVIETDWEEILQEYTPSKLEKFHRDVHSLCGSSATYGFKETSLAARDLETFLKALIANNQNIGIIEQEKISRFLQSLKETLPP